MGNAWVWHVIIKAFLFLYEMFNIRLILSRALKAFPQASASACLFGQQVRWIKYSLEFHCSVCVCLRISFMGMLSNKLREKYSCSQICVMLKIFIHNSRRVSETQREWACFVYSYIFISRIRLAVCLFCTNISGEEKLRSSHKNKTVNKQTAKAFQFSY